MKKIIIFIIAIINILLIYAINNKITILETENLITLSSSEKYFVDDNEISSLIDSGLDGEEYNFDSTYYIYYSKLNNAQKKIYKQLYANVLNIEENIVPKFKLSIEEAEATVESLYNDHPELFWLNTQYTIKYDKKKNCVQINLSYNTTSSDIPYYQKLIDDSISSIIENASKLNSAYEKELYVHNSLINSIEYDESALMNQTIYSALVNKKTVCAGYARAFQYIMNKLNIPTYYVTGTSNEEHAWNIIKLDDGYYNVDLTWDDQHYDRYEYFNISDSELNNTHTRSTISSKLPSCNATKYRNYKIENNSYSFDTYHQNYENIPYNSYFIPEN